MTRYLTALLFSAALLPLAGCGQKLVPVTGVVKLDGKPVAGAAVTFISDDGKTTAGGETDENGNFTLTSPKGPGTVPGTYKVTVTKYPKVEGGVPTPPDASGKMDKDYEKAMKQQMKGSKAPAGGMKMPTPGMGAGGIMPPGGMMPMPGGGSQSSAKSELPEIYSSIERTPFTIKVPAEGPVTLDLKSK